MRMRATAPTIAGMNRGFLRRLTGSASSTAGFAAVRRSLVPRFLTLPVLFALGVVEAFETDANRPDADILGEDGAAALAGGGGAAAWGGRGAARGERPGAEG